MRFRVLGLTGLLLAMLPSTGQAELMGWNNTDIATLSPVEQRWYQQDYDNSWDSLRTYHLMTPLRAPIKVYVDTRPSALYRPVLLQDVKDALAAWSEPLQGRLKYEFVSDPDDAQIRVGWVDHFADPEQAGETAIQVGHSVIEIKSVGYPENIVRTNVMHEMGHALGITGHSPRQEDIMSAEREWTSVEEYRTYQAALTDEDKQAIQLLYSQAWVQGEDLYRAISLQRTASRNIGQP